MPTTERSLIMITALLPEKSASLEAHALTPHKNQGFADVARRLGVLLEGLPTSGGKLAVRIDKSTTVQASLTVTTTFADFTANDKLWLITPDGDTVILTAKTSGAVAANGEFNAVTNDNTCATNLNAALAAYPHALRYFTATVSTNVVTIKPATPGTMGNAFRAKVKVTGGTPMALSNSGSFASGVDGFTPKALTNTITQASLVDNTDTLVFGGTAGVTLTWKTSPSGENEVAIGASDTAAASNLVAKINAHSVLGKIFVATSAVGVVTITYRGDPRAGRLVGLTEAGNGQVLSATHFGSGATVVAQSDTVIVASGGAG